MNPKCKVSRVTKYSSVCIVFNLTSRTRQELFDGIHSFNSQTCVFPDQLGNL